MTAETTGLSIVAVTHRSGELALRSLRSARARLGEVSAQWLIVDCGSGDGTPELIETTLDMQVIRCPNLGFAAGANIGLRRACGRYALLINPDVEIVDGSLEALVAALDARPRVAAASVTQRSHSGDLQPSIRRFPTAGRHVAEVLMAESWPMLHGLKELESRASRYEAEQRIDWAVGAFLILRMDAVRATGDLLDERFFLYAEETDLCLRLRDAGWEVRHLPWMTVVHHTPGTARPELAAQLVHSKLLFARKHFGTAGAVVTRWSLAATHIRRLLIRLSSGALGRSTAVEVAAERRALATALGLARPPFGASARHGRGDGSAAPVRTA